MKSAEPISKNVFLLFIFSVLSLQELCCRAIVRRTSVYAIDQLPLPPRVKSHLKSYALTSSQCINIMSSTKKNGRCKTPTLPSSTRNSCSISWRNVANLTMCLAAFWYYYFKENTYFPATPQIYLFEMLNRILLMHTI